MENEAATQEPNLKFILPHLSAQDDESLWGVALDVLCREIELELEGARLKADIFLQIGACSHWLRPHQTRWTAAGGFAWPAGYGAPGSSRHALPELEWSILLRRDTESGMWHPVEKLSGKHQLTLRVALPTRTARHPQAAVHAVWLPSSPASGELKPVRLYGFRKIEGVWRCVASQ